MEQLPEKLPGNPLPIVGKWLDHARTASGLPNPDAMSLATIDGSGRPSVRIVLCKNLVVDPGYMCFYTNYESAKSGAITQDSRVAGVFHWDELNRQLRIEGRAVRSPTQESDEYFASRDKESQVSAWASSQSRPIPDRRVLLNKHAATARKLSDLQAESGATGIPRPPFWGGYRIWIDAIELWCRGTARFHDRGRWTRSLGKTIDGGYAPSGWSSTRLQP